MPRTTIARMVRPCRDDTGKHAPTRHFHKRKIKLSLGNELKINREACLPCGYKCETNSHQSCSTLRARRAKQLRAQLEKNVTWCALSVQDLKPGSFRSSEMRKRSAPGSSSSPHSQRTRAGERYCMYSQSCVVLASLGPPL